MSEVYKVLEKEVNEIEAIEDWTEKIKRMKQIKDKIEIENKKLQDVLNKLLEDEIEDSSDNNEDCIEDLDSLLKNFTNLNLDDNIKSYQSICRLIKKVEIELFS